MRKFLTKRRLRHGSVSIALTLLVVAAMIIVNAATSALAAGFGLYADMSQSLIYDIGKDCRDYLETAIFPLMDKRNAALGKDQRIEVIFCDEMKNLDNDKSQEYVLSTILDLKKTYPDRVEISHLNVWENPKEAKAYGVVDASDIIFKFGENFTTLSLHQFYVLSGNNSETPTAYNAERRISSAFLRVVSENTPTCYLTLNHGEGLESNELLYTLADAGFNYAFIDLAASDIPEDCELLITVNPTSDLLEPSETSQISETAKLDSFMSDGGKYMVLLSAETLSSHSLKNFESFMAKWGVRYMTGGSETSSGCYLVRDRSSSISIDGNKFFGQYANNSVANNIFGGADKTLIFNDATALTAAEGFSPANDGTYVSGTKIYAPILQSYSSAEAWSGGLLVDKATDNPFTLASLTTDTCKNGKTSYLFVSSSVDFCSEEALQSTVYGNNQTFMRILSHMGYDNIPLSITSRALTKPPIQSLTTRSAAVITVLLCAIPTAIISTVGIFVLVRRKHS